MENKIFKGKMSLAWSSCINIDEKANTIKFASFVNNKAFEKLSFDDYVKVHELCNIINKGYSTLNDNDAGYISEQFNCNAKAGGNTARVSFNILKELGFTSLPEFNQLYAEYRNEINPESKLTVKQLMALLLEMPMESTVEICLKDADGNCKFSNVAMVYTDEYNGNNSVVISD